MAESLQGLLGVKNPPCETLQAVLAAGSEGPLCEPLQAVQAQADAKLKSTFSPASSTSTLPLCPTAGRGATSSSTKDDSCAQDPAVGPGTPQRLLPHPPSQSDPTGTCSFLSLTIFPQFITPC